MNLFDRITLLRAGYTRKEIDAMIEEDQRQSEAEDKMLQQVGEPAEAPKDPDPEPEEKKPEEIPPKPSEPDYKAKYEEEKAAKEALQKMNRDRDRTTSRKSDEEVVKDIVSSFF